MRGVQSTTSVKNARPKLILHPYQPQQGGGKYKVFRLFLLFLLGRRGLLFAHGAGLAAGRALLGFAARIHRIAAFLAGKDGHDYTSESDKLTVSGHRGKKRRCGSSGKPRFWWPYNNE
jgi:hypothetical protein